MRYANPSWRSSINFKASQSRFQERNGGNCDVVGCLGEKSYFVGTKWAWLHFCAKHRAEAIAINTYFAQHPNARPREIKQ